MGNVASDDRARFKLNGEFVFVEGRLGLGFQLLMAVEKGWFRLDGYRLLGKVMHGVISERLFDG